MPKRVLISDRSCPEASCLICTGSAAAQLYLSISTSTVTNHLLSPGACFPSAFLLLRSTISLLRVADFHGNFQQARFLRPRRFPNKFTETWVKGKSQSSVRSSGHTQILTIRRHTHPPDPASLLYGTSVPYRYDEV